MPGETLGAGGVSKDCPRRELNARHRTSSSRSGCAVRQTSLVTMSTFGGEDVTVNPFPGRHRRTRLRSGPTPLNFTERRTSMGDATHNSAADNTTIEPATLRIPSASGEEIGYSSERDLMA
jgi:hypothetical protein